MTSNPDQFGTLVLGIGNVLMGDEGVGVRVVETLSDMSLPEGVRCLDGGTGGFHLLDPVLRADRIVLIDATVDGSAPGTLSRLKPKFSTDYPRTLTAHDIGLRDLLDAFYLLGRPRNLTLFAISIAPLRDMRIGLSEPIAARVPEIARRVLAEVSNA